MGAPSGGRSQVIFPPPNLYLSIKFGGIRNAERHLWQGSMKAGTSVSMGEGMQRHDYCQIAWVVEDIDQTMHYWITSGQSGPFFVNYNALVQNVWYEGSEISFRRSIAIAQAGDIQIELIQQTDDVRSIYNRADLNGSKGPHHLGCFVADVISSSRYYDGNDSPELYKGYFREMPFSYVDTRKQIGVMLELLEHKPVIDDLFDYVREASLNWSGEDPVRPFPHFAETIDNASK